MVAETPSTTTCGQSVLLFFSKHVRYYLLDWVLSFVVFGTALIIDNAVTAHQVIVPSNDVALDYPKIPSSISTTVLIFIANGIPIALVALLQILPFSRKWDRTLDLHHFLLSMLETTAFSTCLTNVLKIFAGRLRPNYYELIKSKSEHDRRQAHMSYPSGHASLAFAGFTLTALYLAGKSGIFNKRDPASRGPRSTKFAKALLFVFLPILVAALIAVTRTRDYWHNYSDINAGAIIGVASATLAYKMNYCDLSHPLSHLTLDSYPVDRSSDERTSV